MKRGFVCIALLLLLGEFAIAEPTTAPTGWESLGGPQLQQWIGVQSTNDAATLSLPGTAAFHHPAGPRGFYRVGFRQMNDSTSDWVDDFGIRFDARLEADRDVELTINLLSARQNASDRVVPAVIHLRGVGWHTVTLPWSSFDFKQAGYGFLRFGSGISIEGKFTDAQPGSIQLRDVRAIRAATISMSTDIYSKATDPGTPAGYDVSVTNCTNQTQAVIFSQISAGWHTMEVSIEPATMTLAPGESSTAHVRISMTDRVPPGGHETQTIQAIANGDAASAATIHLITTRRYPHPYILHTAQRWDEVRGKVAKYPWAKEQQDRYIATADKWDVPQIAKPPQNDPNDNYGVYLFRTTEENNLLASAFAWELTHEQKDAEKVATFLRRLSDPQTGYPVTMRACNQSQVQEGHFFQHMAMCYDIILDAGVLSAADEDQIEQTFRLLIGTIERMQENGAINNWNLSENCGAFYCALALQDLSLADRFFSGPGGICDQLAKGTMDDGWWYECSISYNMWCASEFTQAALAYQPFGYNLLHAWLPANFSPTVMLTTELSGGNTTDSPQPWMKGKPFGMDPSLYGPVRRPYRTITDLWNSLLPFIDYRGVMFGVNDSTENQVTGNRAEVGGQPFEIAYYAFRDPQYAAIIQRGRGPRDLLYGVPELPGDTPQQFRDSAYADNVGLAMLRSQTPDRPIREQIQAVLHYGTHGWAHGHYDRTDLLSLMRYGRSFWNPEADWWGYEPFMYKFFVQASENHNMVVVDQKMQQATPGERLLWHTGKAFQATVVQTTARWSYPPYGGMVYDYVPVKTFAEKTWREGRYVPIPATQPAYGTLTDFTEPVLQRRLMVVTDDYVLLADYLKGDKPHTFDNLLQIKGFLGIDSAGKKLAKHTSQYNGDPLGSAQFITDCDWYAVQAPAVARFEEKFGDGVGSQKSIGSEPGVLKLDVHSLWPPQQQMMVGNVPEDQGITKRLSYTVSGDGKVLASGKFGSWLLGRGDVDVSLNGIKQLELETSTELSKKPSLFWAAAKVTTRDGKQIALNTLPMKFDNILPQNGKDRDYFGGEIKIAGDAYVDSVPAEPQSDVKPGIVRVDLTSIDATRLTCVIGSDYPPGDDPQHRKVLAIRAADDQSARFLTLIEPYETSPIVRGAHADSANTIVVDLNDGRTQTITLHDFDGDGSHITVDLNETRSGATLRSESTQ